MRLNRRAFAPAVLLPFLLLCSVPGPSAAQPASPAPSQPTADEAAPPQATPGPTPLQSQPTFGRDLPAVRFVSPPVIDGDISDACWQQAARAEHFTDGFDGKSAPDQTVAFIGYDDKRIYVAFRCYDSQPQSIVARERKRGTRFRGEDTVAFALDLFHSRKFSDRSFFIVNALGTQFARLAGERAAKLEWEGEWQAGAKRTEDGWTAEIAVPWSILNYPYARGPVTVGLNFDRFQPRTDIHSWWSNLGPQEHLERDGTWRGVEFPPFRRQLSLLPYTIPGIQEDGGSGVRSGLDARALLTPSLTLVGTINPDFQNVEGDVEGIDFSYGQRFVSERRPFFLEGSGFYGGGGAAGRNFYSPNIPAFDTGVKLFGKVTPRDAVGLLGAFDFGKQADWVLRGRHEFGPTGSFEAMFLNRDRAEDGASDDGTPTPARTNRVLTFGQDQRWGNWNLGSDWGGSWVDGRFTGDFANLSVGYNGPRSYAYVEGFYVRPDYQNDLGLTFFTDYRGVEVEAGGSNSYRSGPLREIDFGGGFDYSRHFDGRLFERNGYVYAGLRTRNDWRLSADWNGGRFETFNDRVFSVSLRARASDPFHNFGVGYSWGRQAGAPYSFLTPSVTWRFGEKLTLGLSSAILRHTEDIEQHIFTFGYDFSPRQGVGGRIVSRSGGTNGYLAFRRSGYGGTETFLIVGDPNALKFAGRVVLKIVWSL